MTDELRPARHFVLRAPRWSFQPLLAMNDSAPGTSGDPQRWKLAEAVGSAEIAEAFRIASPQVAGRLDEWRRDPLKARGQRMERSVVRYFTRMCSRPTPFGDFAGIAPGRIADATNLVLGPREEHRRHVRIDNQVLFRLVDEVLGDPAARRALRWWPNQSLYRRGLFLRWPQTRTTTDGLRSQHLMQAETSEHVLGVLERAAGGASLESLATHLVEKDAEIEMDEALEFVSELASLELLQSDLDLPVTGPEPAHAVRACLEEVGLSEYAARLRQAMDAVEALQLGRVSAEARREVEAEVQELAPTGSRGAIVQIDVVLDAPKLTLGQEAEAALRRTVDVVRRLSSPQDRSSLEEFRRKLIDRWEGRPIPLLDVVDEEIGIGYGKSAGPGTAGSPLLVGLPLKTSASEEVSHPWSAERRYLAERVYGLLAEGGRVLKLDDEDLSILGQNEEPLPDALSAMVTLVAESGEAIDRGGFEILVQGVAGPSGARLLGRFCQASEETREMVEEHLREEEALRPDVLFAEVVHLNQGREGNLVCRPVLRKHEIPISPVSGAPAEDLIPLDDLLLSVEEGEIVLRSASRGKRVVPRITSALRIDSGSPPVYRLLADLQVQDGGSFGWDWGGLVDLPVLPRVQYGNTILTRARWVLGPAEIALFAEGVDPVKAASSNEEAREAMEIVFKKVTQLREKLDLPRWVVLPDGDQEMVVDLDNPLLASNLAWTCHRRERVVLLEAYPTPDRLPLRSEEGPHAHQLVVFWSRRSSRSESAADRPIPVPAADAEATAAPAVRRSFPPGSSWLYAKLYTGEVTADSVLRTVVAPVCAQALREGWGDRWHFIRFHDPDHHLRMRVHGGPAELGGSVLSALHDAARPLIEVGLVVRMQIDTYGREIERYGGPWAIERIERLFWHDSEAVVAALSQLDGDVGHHARWKLAFLGTDRLLRDLCLSPEQRERLVLSARDRMQDEFNQDIALYRAIGARFEVNREELEALLGGESDDGALARGIEIFDQRSHRNREVVEELRKLEAAGRLAPGLETIAWSLVHMHCNRLLQAHQRAHELVLYDFLRRGYAVMRHRAKGSGR